MKKEKNHTAPVEKPRTVKISAEKHHTIRIMSVIDRVPMQSLIDQILDRGMARMKSYKKLQQEHVEHATA